MSFGPDLAARGGEGTEPGDPQLPELLKELARSRQLLHIAISKKEKFLLNDEYQKILDNIADAKAMVQVGEKIVRQTAMDYYQASGDKHPHANIEIKEVSVCRYEIPKAEEWCRTNLLESFEWNQNYFEKYAIVNKDLKPVPGVEILKDPHATISTDLSGLIPDIKDAQIPF